VNKGRDMAVYRQYLKDQVRELLTSYGTIDVIWLDFRSRRRTREEPDDWTRSGS